MQHYEVPFVEHDTDGEESSSTDGPNTSQYSEYTYFASSPALTASHIQEMNEVLGIRAPPAILTSAWGPTYSCKLDNSVPGVSEVQDMCFTQADKTPYSDMDTGLLVGKPMSDKKRNDLLMKIWCSGQLPTTICM